jgi:ATP:ADP antiporter, AAA family
VSGPAVERRHFSILERLFRLFADVQPREGVTCLILIGNIFLILVAFYLIKPVREGWLAVTDIRGFTKLEIKAYSAFAQSLLLFAILPLYAFLAARLPRRKLITRVGGAFGLALVAFWLSQPGLLFGSTPFFGILFYLFVGIFSVTLVAQFWAFSSDVYGAERGARLFPAVAVGAALGATVGSWLGQTLVRLPWIEAFDLILIALVPLGLALALAAWTDHRGTYCGPTAWTTERWDQPAAPHSENPFKLILRHRYLSATAAMIMVFTWVVTSGDNILFGIVQERLAQDLAYLQPDQGAFAAAMKEATATFYSDLYFWVNLITLVLQAFVVSRILNAGGIQALLYATPFISLAAYASMIFLPILGLIKILKVAENSSTLSIHNTARQMLWLPTTKEMLYQAKPTIDTLFVRLGDGMAALTILIGTRVFHLGNLGFIIVNIGLVMIWFALSAYLQQENQRWTAQAVAPPTRSFESVES